MLLGCAQWQHSDGALQVYLTKLFSREVCPVTRWAVSLVLHL